MLTSYSSLIYFGILLFTLFLYVCAIYSYRLNAKRAPDDPKKLEVPFGVLLLVPITWPILLVGMVSLFILRALIYLIFLFLFAIALLVIRKPFLFVWLEKAAIRIGDGLLRATVLLMKVAFGDYSKKTQET